MPSRTRRHHHTIGSPSRLRREVKGGHTESQPVLQRIGQRWGPVASHAKGPGPEGRFDRGLGFIRTRFRPQDLIALRYGRFRETLEFDRAQRLATLKGLFPLFQCLEEAAGLATGMAGEAGPLPPRPDPRPPPPPHTPDPLPHPLPPQTLS